MYYLKASLEKKASEDIAALPATDISYITKHGHTTDKQVR